MLTVINSTPNWKKKIPCIPPIALSRFRYHRNTVLITSSSSKHGRDNRRYPSDLISFVLLLASHPLYFVEANKSKVLNMVVTCISVIVSLSLIPDQGRRQWRFHCKSKISTVAKIILCIFCWQELINANPL